MITFEYDQPFETQEPAGSTATVTSQRLHLRAQRAPATWSSAPPQQQQRRDPGALADRQIPTAGSYFVAIQVVSGPNPGHVEFVGVNDTNVALTISQQFGSAGGTYYPTSFGHETDADTIGVGATPWWAPAPTWPEPAGQRAVQLVRARRSTSSTRTGTAIDRRRRPRTRRSRPRTAATRRSSRRARSSTPPTLRSRASRRRSTNLSQDLPSFFGTSSAAPNAAAVAALMLQQVPSLTPAEIRAGLIASAERTR